MKEKYNCDVCGLEVKVVDDEKHSKLAMNFTEDTYIKQSYNVCEVCAGHIVNFIRDLGKSGREFYNKNK